jgi:AP endonuclease-1
MKRSVSTSPTRKKIKLEGNQKWIGAHVSASKGVFNAIPNALDIHAQSFALFLKNQRRWDSKPFDNDTISQFRSLCLEHNFVNKVLPHGSYLINLGNPDTDKRKKSYDAFLDDLVRCEQLGISLYNFHPGSTVGHCTREESISFIAECINQAHQQTSKVICVIENMAGQGNTIGSKFEELRDIIDLVKDQKRIGVCLDTCHMFAAGYDIRTRKAYEEVMTQFDKIAGFKFLKGVHLNDSKADLGSGKDRHENIGKGKIGLDAFRFLVNDERFNEIPMVLETPIDDKFEIYAQEIQLLYSLIEKT